MSAQKKVLRAMGRKSLDPDVHPDIRLDVHGISRPKTFSLGCYPGREFQVIKAGVLVLYLGFPLRLHQCNDCLFLPDCASPPLERFESPPPPSPISLLASNLVGITVTTTTEISQKHCEANGRRIAIVLRYKWEKY